VKVKASRKKPQAAHYHTGVRLVQEGTPETCIGNMSMEIALIVLRNGG
jgi:hypothetical protein